jgi:tyrosine-protein phosphatase YwqE
MVTAMLISFEKNGVLIVPLEKIDLKSVVGKKVRYQDYKNQIWWGVIKDVIDNEYLFVEFEKEPEGLAVGIDLEIVTDTLN